MRFAIRHQEVFVEEFEAEGDALALVAPEALAAQQRLGHVTVEHLDTARVVAVSVEHTRGSESRWGWELVAPANTNTAPRADRSGAYPIVSL